MALTNNDRIMMKHYLEDCADKVQNDGLDPQTIVDFITSTDEEKVVALKTWGTIKLPELIQRLSILERNRDKVQVQATFLTDYVA